MSPVLIVEGKRIVGGVLGAIDTAHFSQLHLQAFYTMSTYAVVKIIAALTDGRVWHVFRFELVSKTDISTCASHCGGVVQEVHSGRQPQRAGSVSGGLVVKMHIQDSLSEQTAHS